MSKREGKKNQRLLDTKTPRPKKYLRLKEKELSGCYEIIKGYLRKPNDKYDDALYVTAFINEMLYFLSGPAVDDRCIYVRIVKNRKNVKLSDWVVNEFFAPLKEDNAYFENWLDMDEKQKYETIYGTLMASSEECL